METLFFAWAMVALYFMLVQLAPPSPVGTAIDDDDDFAFPPQGHNHGLHN